MRYFVASFSWVKGLEVGFGEISMKAKVYPSRGFITKQVGEKKDDAVISILNIQELSKQDFESYLNID